MYIFKKLTVLIFFLLFSSMSLSEGKSDIDIFVNSFVKAISNNNISKAVKMNEWAGLPEQQRKSIEASFSDIAKKGIINYRVAIIANGEDIVFEKKGNVFSPNLSPVAQLFIEVNTNKNFGGGYSYYIGKEDDALKISHVVLKKP